MGNDDATTRSTTTNDDATTRSTTTNDDATTTANARATICCSTATANATTNGTTKPANASDRYRCRTKIRCPKLKPIYTYIHITNMENVNWEGWGMVYTL